MRGAATHSVRLRRLLDLTMDTSQIRTEITALRERFNALRGYL